MIFEALQSLLAIYGIAAVLFILFPRQRRDRFRSDIRGIRDNLFLFVAEHKMDFRNPAYTECRNRLNGLIRMSNTISIVRFILLCKMHSELDAMRGRQKDQFDRMPDGPLRDAIDAAYNDATDRLLTFLFCEGLTGVFVRCFVRAIQFSQWATRVAIWVRDKADGVVSDANKYDDRLVAA